MTEGPRRVSRARAGLRSRLADLNRDRLLVNAGTAAALCAWRAEPRAPPERYRDVIAMLAAAGTVVQREWLDDDNVRADPKLLAALAAQVKPD